MKHLRIYKPFSVVVVPFPFTNSSITKRRPAIVISKETYQTKNKHISLLMVTSVKHSSWFGDYEIQNLNAAGLQVKSIIRQKIFTIDLRLVISRIGSLAKPDKEQVITACKQHLYFE